MMRIATLCGMGFGTSMMLKLSVDEILAAEGIKAEVLAWDVGSFKGQQIDIVVAASDMRRQLEGADATVALIDNLVSKDEIRTKVLAAIKEHEEREAGP
jgi:ascorbate PTS system EIIB component